MRQDQFERLQALEEKLIDVLLVEADPANWPGTAETLANADDKTRGDRVWLKRGAAMTLGVIHRIAALTNVARAQTPPEGGTTGAAGVDDSGDIDDEVRQAEQEGARLLAKIQSRANAKA